MFEVLGTGAPPIISSSIKLEWDDAMSTLIALRKSANIGEVMDHLRRCPLLRLPTKVEAREQEFANWSSEVKDDEPGWVSRLRKLRAVPYSEISALDAFIDGHTPYSTKHGVKGAEFENVLVVVGRGWNKYNFDQMLCWFKAVPNGKEETFVQSRNLFYVACSRSKRCLAVLFTQELSAPALDMLVEWFGADAVRALPHL